MMTNLPSFIQRTRDLLKTKPIQSIIIVGLLLSAYFVRVFRLHELLGFYYDQGRDAKIIWDLIYNGELFLIGPTTGIEGIFRGPWYYWLITPFYALSKGSPVLPAVFLASTTVIALVILFKLVQQATDATTAFIALIIGSYSYFLIYAARWLSNPTPMMLISTLLLWSMFLIIDGKRWAWAPIGFLLGQAMQFGSAAEVFYFPVVFIFAVWQRKNLPNIKVGTVGVMLFLISFLPQIAFDLRNDRILSNNIKSFLFSEGSFKTSIIQVLEERLVLYKDVFYSKLFPITTKERNIWAVITIGLALLNIKSILKSNKLKSATLLLATPLIGMIFFQGNYGNIFDYYFTGYYLIFVFVFSALMGITWKKHVIGKFLVLSFLLVFLRQNLEITKNYITSGVDGPTTIALANQISAIKWVYEDLSSNCPEFNIDVYVPPVIPHAYEYLFRWYGKKVVNCNPSLNNVPLLYTLYEQDPPHPERLENWLARQNSFSQVNLESRFGGITVQRRTRLYEQNTQ